MRTLLLAGFISFGIAFTQLAAAEPQQTNDRSVTLAFDNEDVRNVVQLYHQLTGFKIIQDNFVQGKVTLRIDQPVSRPEAIVLIEKTLMNNGYSLVEAEKGTVQVVGTGKNPRSLGLPIVSEPNDVPKSERIISYVFKLRHLDPTHVQQMFGQYLSPPMPYTSFLAMPESRAVMVTDRTSVIRELISLMYKLDVPPQ